MQVSGGGGVAGAGGAPAGQAGDMAMAEQGPGWGWKEYFITGTVVLGAAVVAKVKRRRRRRSDQPRLPRPPLRRALALAIAVPPACRIPRPPGARC